MRQGFYSPYFIVPKKGGGLRPILDLRVLNRALHKLPFKMLMHRRMIKCIQPQDWFAAIDLKDAYFHISILPRHWELGKEQALPCAENLFSRCGVRLGEYDGTPHGGTCPSSAELPEFLQRQECGTTETVSEAPGAYGVRSCSHAARIASYSSSSSSPLLSLVTSTSEISHQPVHTYTTYIYKGVDRTGRQGI